MKISKTCITLLISIAALAVVSFGVGIFFASDIAAYSKGLAFGTIFTMLKVVLLEKTLNKAVDMSKKNADNYARLHFTLRYILTGVVLAVSALSDGISLWGAIIGIIILQPAAYIANYRLRNKEV